MIMRQFMNRKISKQLLAAFLAVSLLSFGCAGREASSVSPAPVSSSAVPQPDTSSETETTQIPSGSETETDSVQPSSQTPDEPQSSAEPSSAPEPSSEEAGNAAVIAYLRENYPGLIMVNSAAGLNIRQRPTTEAPIIGKLTPQAAAADLKDSEREGWLHIRSGQVEGYVSAEYVLQNEEALKKAAESAAAAVLVTVEAANIRRGPSVDTDVMDTVPQGTVFQILSEESGFFRIPFGTQEAYISGVCVHQIWTLPEAEPVIVPEPTTPDVPPSSVSPTPSDTPQPVPDITGLGPQQIITGWNGHAVCIDPGHQRKGIASKEPIAPGSSETKTALSTGTCGVVTRVDEHVVNLQVSLKLRDILASRGYTVIMIRITDDCPVTNAQRAMIANESGADINIRVHCNGIDNQSTTGIINYAPGDDNPYMDAATIQKSFDLARLEGEAMCAITGAKNLGVLKSNGMTGINWSKIPVTILEMGFMSNPDEDRLLVSDSYQNLLAEGIANGIDQYFATH